MKKTFVLLSILKKKARQLQKEKSLTWHQALNESAKEFGYTNYQNYKNISEAHLKQYKSAMEVLLKNISLETDIPKKMELAISSMENYETPLRDLFDILNQFQHSEEIIQVVCEKLNLMKEEIQLFLFNDFLTDEGKNEINFRAPHFIAKEISISDLTYEINEDALYVDGNYVLKTEFEFELDANDPTSKDERFKDREFEGSFGVEVDANKNITFVHSDMSTDNELTSPRGFTEEEIEDYYKRFPDERGRFDDILVLDDYGYDEVKRCLSNNEPLTGRTLELALDLVDVHGDDEQSLFVKNIGVKMKAGQALDEYEHHVLVDVLMLHAQLGA